VITGHDIPLFNLSFQDSDANNFWKVKVDFSSLWKAVMQKIMDFKGYREDELVRLQPIYKNDKKIKQPLRST